MATPAKAAAAIVTKPVIGRKRTLTYKTEVERDGEIVEAQVVEERSLQVGPLGAVLGAIGALLVAGTAAGALRDPRGFLDKAKGKAVLAKYKSRTSLFGLGIVPNPFAPPPTPEEAQAALDAEPDPKKREEAAKVLQALGYQVS